MPPYKLGYAVSDGIRSSGHRLMRQESAQIIAKRRHIGIALLGGFLERFRKDVVEIAVERAATSGILCCGGCARSVLVDDRPHEVSRSLYILRRSLSTGEQQVQHETQRIDVGPGRDRLTEQLLGGCILRRQRAEAGFCAASGVISIVQQFGDAEIEKLDGAPERDEY